LTTLFNFQYIENMKTLNSKISDITKKIARELTKYQIGMKIPTTPELAQKFSVGFGTIDKAMTALKEMEAIKLQPKGQRGTYLLEKDSAALWSIMDSGPIIGSLPLPNTLEFQGLASGLKESLREKKVECTFSIKNGSTLRINELLNHQCDFVLMSYQAAVSVCEKHKNLKIIGSLHAKSYYGDIIVLSRRDASKETSDWRIGVDETSLDHIAFTKDLFETNTKENVMYMHIPYLIADGVIDAAVWHSSQLVPTKLIEILTFRTVNYEEADDSINRMSGAIVVNTDREEIFSLLTELCDVDRILEIQKEVIARKRVPYY
jgi:YhfZ C-terminal domain/Helix-turn-helix domain